MLNQYFARLEIPQVAFAARQAKPKTVEDAVKVTLKMESYLQPVGTTTSTLAQVTSIEDSGVVATATRLWDDSLKILLQRMDHMEANLKAAHQPVRPRQLNNSGGGSKQWQKVRSKPLVCWNCGGEGHFLQNCPSLLKQQQQQGNNQLSVH